MLREHSVGDIRRQTSLTFVLWELSREAVGGGSQVVQCRGK
nr:hypothetical protein [Marinobacter sp. DS40M8]